MTKRLILPALLLAALALAATAAAVGGMVSVVLYPDFRMLAPRLISQL